MTTITIESRWYIYKSTLQNKQSSLYSQIGLIALHAIEAFMQQNPMLQTTLKGLKIGFVGDWNADFGKRSSVTTKGISTRVTPGDEKAPTGGGHANTPGENRSERPVSSVLEINTSHKLFPICEKSDDLLVKLHMFIATQAVEMLSAPAELQVAIYERCDTAAESFVAILQYKKTK